MSEKIKTLILTVDLECDRCNKKIRRVICKVQERINIQSVEYNVKENKVIIKGPFDPDCLSKKLRCMACKIITCYHIPPETPPKPPVEVKPPTCKPPPCKLPTCEPPTCKPPPCKPPTCELKLNPCPYPYPYPLAFTPVCCHTPCPCYKGHGGCRCCSCGMAYDNLPPARPITPYHCPPLTPYRCPPPSCGYQIVCQEDTQTCAIM